MLLSGLLSPLTHGDPRSDRSQARRQHPLPQEPGKVWFRVCFEENWHQKPWVTGTGWVLAALPHLRYQEVPLHLPMRTSHPSEAPGDQGRRPDSLSLCHDVATLLFGRLDLQAQAVLWASPSSCCGEEPVPPQGPRKPGAPGLRVWGPLRQFFGVRPTPHVLHAGSLLLGRPGDRRLL